MVKTLKWISIAIIGILCGVYMAGYAREQNIQTNLVKLKLPDGFNIQVFSELDALYGKPRMMAFDASGNLYVTLANTGKIVQLSDTNSDGVADTPVVLAQGLNAPNGITFVNDDLLIANQDGVVKITQTQGKWSTPTPFISNLPSGGHTLKTIRLAPDNYLYLNVGSSCNVCVEDDPMRATILRYTSEGKPAGSLQVVGRHTNLAPIWASGLRNSQGFAWQPTTGDFYATNEGADNRSAIKNGAVNDDLPPEHLNIIQASNHYGWPHCWYNTSALNTMFEDPNFVGPENFCKNSTPPAITFTSHSTPIGITFLDKSHFPAEYKNDAVVALHGSWNRKQPSGYKLVRVHFKDNKPVAISDFVTGWLNNGQVFGRPVDVIVGPDGALYVSDDKAAVIYKIRYQDH